MNSTDTGTIVVGVDGSDHAERALAWAVEEAKLRGARIRLVTAWHVPVAAYGAPGFLPTVTPSLEESTRTVAEEVVAAAQERAGSAGVEAETSVRQGQAADALLEEAAGADLLVVGSRGHGGFAGLLLGSVSAQCAHHAPCPLVIVH